MAFPTGDPARACAAALEEGRGYTRRGGSIAIERHGNVALPYTSRVMFRAPAGEDGRVNGAVGDS
jgi:isoaspartyl peptidase/L-asparaginase-like protein (Ntn-hydrolase superfamily)